MLVLALCLVTDVAAADAAVSDASQAPLLEGRPPPHAQTNQIPNVCLSLPVFVFLRVITIAVYGRPA